MNRANPITVNRYVVSRGQNESVVLYWYQAHEKVVASEYRAKLFTVFDSMRYRRSDTSLVRVVVPVAAGNTDRAVTAAQRFIQSLFAPLPELFALIKNALPSIPENGWQISECWLKVVPLNEVGSRTVSRAVGSLGGCRLGGCLHCIPLRLHEYKHVSHYSLSQIRKGS